MSRLRELCELSGHETSGSDVLESGHSPQNVVGADMVVYSSAIHENNVELAEASRLGVACVTRAELLGSIASGYEQVIAIAGTHGKTTTCAMTAQALSSFPVTTHIGGDVADTNGGKIFLTEACEYQRSFLSLRPSVGVILNAEWDHPDCYESQTEYEQAFVDFAKNASLLIVNGDDAFLSGVEHKNKITFGLARGNDFYAREQGGGFSVWYKDIYIGEIALAVKGRHNVLNALAATVIALTLGVNLREISSRLGAFGGVKRRMEKLGEWRGRTVYSDYAHHPTEIRAALSVFNRPPVVFFEPHTYSRTRAYLGDFATAFASAKRVALLPVYAARESGGDGVLGELFSRLSEAKETRLLGGYDEIEETLEMFTSERDEVVFMGAGSIDSAARRLIK